MKVVEFRYLGSVLRNKGVSGREVKERIQAVGGDEFKKKKIYCRGDGIDKIQLKLLRWSERIQRCDATYVRAKMLRMDQPGRGKKRKTKKETDKCDEGKHASGWRKKMQKTKRN